MKDRELNWMVFVLIGGVLIALFVRELRLPQSPLNSHHKDLPPGYTLESNGTSWRWVRERNGLEDRWLPQDTKQAAIDNAWAVYSFDHEPEYHPVTP